MSTPSTLETHLDKPVDEGRLSQPPRIVTAAMTPQLASGVRDYAEILNASLRERNFQVDSHYIDADGANFLTAIRCGLRMLKVAWSCRQNEVMLAHYSPFSFAFRGVPLVGALFGTVAQLRGARVIVVLHELFYGWNTGRGKRRLIAVTQWLTLRLVLMNADGVLVTTEPRKRYIEQLPKMFSPLTLFAPVFSTIPRMQPKPPLLTGQRPRLVVPSFTGDQTPRDLLLDALVSMSPTVVDLVLLGSPGPHAPETIAWTDGCRLRGLPHPIFTGLVSKEEYSLQLHCSSAVVLLSEEGPTGRRSSLSVALAHGKPVIAINGPLTWAAVADSGAVGLCEPSARALGAQLRRVLGSERLLTSMSESASSFYEREMSVSRTREAIISMVRLQPDDA